MYGDDTKHFKLSIVPVFGVFFFLPLDRPSLNQSLKAFRCNRVEQDVQSLDVLVYDFNRVTMKKCKLFSCIRGNLTRKVQESVLNCT